MSLSKSTLSAIQQAGNALHKATIVVSSAVRDQAEHMVATVASQPYQAEGEQAFANFKMLARLSQDMLSLEDQLKNLYSTAAELSSPVMDVVATLPRPSARARAASNAQTDVAEDAIVKPASARRAKAAGKNAPKKAAKKTARSATLTANDIKVLDYMKSVLTTDQLTPLTGAAVAAGSGLPLGSVGISMKKVVAAGAIKKVGRGSYQLLN